MLSQKGFLSSFQRSKNHHKWDLFPLSAIYDTITTSSIPSQTQSSCPKFFSIQNTTKTHSFSLYSPPFNSTLQLLTQNSVLFYKLQRPKRLNWEGKNG